MDIEYKAKFEDEFWNKLGEIGNESCIIGGDFNMGKEQMEKRLLKEGSRVRREDMAGNPSTFHRWDSVNNNMQSSTIDHVLTSGKGGGKVSNTGLDLNDHSIIIGWLDVPEGVKKVREMKGVKLATLRPADKGATKKIEKAWGKISDNTINKMSMEEIIRENMGIVERISANRNTKRNPNGWSPIARLISLRISVHGTARRMKDKITYDKIISKINL